MEELDWSAETFGVTLNAEIEPKTHHQTPTICLVHMGPVILDQGSPNLFLEGQCPAEFSSNKQSNKPEPDNQGLAWSSSFTGDF